MQRRWRSEVTAATRQSPTNRRCVSGLIVSPDCYPMPSSTATNNSGGLRCKCGKKADIQVSKTQANPFHFYTFEDGICKLFEWCGPQTVNDLRISPLKMLANTCQLGKVKLRKKCSIARTK